MDKKLSKLFITEDTGNKQWILSFEKPEFQGGESIVIDEVTAKEILHVQKS